MRAWTLIIGFVLAVLAGGQAFAMTGHDCGERTQHGMHAAHHPQPRQTPPDDCCSGSSLCRMAGCGPLFMLPLGGDHFVPLKPVAFRPATPLPLTGLALAPPTGPPRSILS